MELIKPVLAEGDEAAKAETRATAAQCSALILRLLHPFMPYISEALWPEFARARRPGSAGAEPLAERPTFSDAAAAAEINWLVALVGAIRSVRSEMNVPAAAQTRRSSIVGGTAELPERVEAATRRRSSGSPASTGSRARDTRAARARRRSSWAAPPSRCRSPASSISPPRRRGSKRRLPASRARSSRIDKKLANESFVARAPEEVVEAEREKRAAYAADGERLAAALKRVKEAA